jgi:hypothetical protein
MTRWDNPNITTVSPHLSPPLSPRGVMKICQPSQLHSDKHGSIFRDVSYRAEGVKGYILTHLMVHRGEYRRQKLRHVTTLSPQNRNIIARSIMGYIVSQRQSVAQQREKKCLGAKYMGLVYRVGNWCFGNASIHSTRKYKPHSKLRR